MKHPEIKGLSYYKKEVQKRKLCGQKPKLYQIIEQRKQKELDKESQKYIGNLKENHEVSFIPDID